VIELFKQRGIACAAIGRTDDSGLLQLKAGDEEQLFWDLNTEPLIGCGPNRQG